MPTRMRYAYYDLGLQRAGTAVDVRLQGGSANLILMDASNFHRYRGGQRFAYHGGHYRRSRVTLRPPRDGHWYLVLDLGGCPGRGRGAVRLRPPGHGRSTRRGAEPLSRKRP